MSIIEGLRKFDAIAFVEIHQKIQSIENQITAYHAQKNTINHLAKAFFFSSAALAVKLVWNKIGGTDLKIAATSSSSVVLGLFALAALGGTLWWLDDGKKKAEDVAGKIQKLYGITQEKFYGDTTEPKEDLVTEPEVLKSMRSCFDKSGHIDTNYTLIVTNEFTLQGTTADDFKCTSVPILTNLEAIKKTLAPWRNYYAELYAVHSNSKPTVLMQVVASQCIQGLAHKTLEDESSYYSCHSPTVLNPKGGSIGHHYKAVSSETEQSHYTTPKQFDEHLVEKLKYLGDLPTTKVHGQMPTLTDIK